MTGTLRPSPAAAAATIKFEPAALGWLTAFVVGNLVMGVVVAVLAAFQSKSSVVTASVPVLVTGLLGMWGIFVVMLVVLSRRYGSADFARDYAVAFKPIDLVMVPLAVATQFSLGIVYWPLRQLWPATFSKEALSKTAHELTADVHGLSAVLLVFAIAVGAPVIEELVYRGLLQRSLSCTVQPVVAWVAVAAWFGFIHFRPVEFLGLFVAGLLFGAGYLFTGRIGPGIVAHFVFNLTGLIEAFRTLPSHR